MKYLSLIFISANLILMPAINHAATKNQLKCKNSSDDFYISGFVPKGGDTYQIEVQRGNHTLQYTSTCIGTACSSVSNDENVYFNDDLDNKIYTVTFSNKLTSSTGTLHALPETMIVTKQPGGYEAEYTALYYGTDPSSNDKPKAFVSKPIKLDCKLTNAGSIDNNLASKP